MIEQALALMEPGYRADFLAAVAKVESTAQLALIAGHLARGNPAAAIVALHLDPAFLAPLDEALHHAALRGFLIVLARPRD
jgi:hypothetical protein